MVRETVPNLRLVAYERVSTARQGRSGLGLDAQRKAIDDFAASRQADVLARFTEIESGRKTDRPELGKALTLARLTGATLVIAKLDRLSRNAAFLLTLRDSGVRFLACDMPEANDLTVGIMALVAQQEREAISRRTKEALAIAKARGVKLGNPNGAAALRRAGDNGRALRRTVAANADAFARDLSPILDSIRAGGHGSLRAIASELPRGKCWDEAVIDLTGGDRMTARLMRQDFFDFDPQLTLMIAGNTQPSFRGVDAAIRSRVVLVPFEVTIPPERRDRALPGKLKAEAPAILRWCIDGAVAWRERGLDVPPAIAAASAAYFDDEDTLGQFLEDETRPDPHGFVAGDELILRFSQWSDRQGLSGWTKRTLVKELRLRGFENGRTNSQRGLRGLRLR